MAVSALANRTHTLLCYLSFPLCMCVFVIRPSSPYVADSPAKFPGYLDALHPHLLSALRECTNLNVQSSSSPFRCPPSSSFRCCDVLSSPSPSAGV